VVHDHDRLGPDHIAARVECQVQVEPGDEGDYHGRFWDCVQTEIHVWLRGDRVIDVAALGHSAAWA
jgi:hypothetical protein